MKMIPKLMRKRWMFLKTVEEDFSEAKYQKVEIV